MAVHAMFFLFFLPLVFLLDVILGHYRRPAVHWKIEITAQIVIYAVVREI